MADTLNLEWRVVLGVHHLIDRNTGKLLASVIQNSEGTFNARYGVLPVEHYIELEPARAAMMKAHEAALEENSRQATVGKPEKKEKKGAGKNS